MMQGKFWKDFKCACEFLYHITSEQFRTSKLVWFVLFRLEFYNTNRHPLSCYWGLLIISYVQWRSGTQRVTKNTSLHAKDTTSLFIRYEQLNLLYILYIKSSHAVSGCEIIILGHVWLAMEGNFTVKLWLPEFYCKKYGSNILVFTV